MYPLKHRLALGGVALHLVLCALGAGSFRFSRIPMVGKGLADYAELTGANSNFGFFAPGVDGQLRTRFDVIGEDGKVVPGALASSNLSHEATLRIGNIVDQFETLQDIADDSSDDDDGSELARQLSASLAGKIFARYAQTRQVVVHLDRYEAISMNDWRQGKRPEWKQIYEVTFALKNPVRTAEAAR